MLMSSPSVLSTSITDAESRVAAGAALLGFYVYMCGCVGELAD